MAAYQVPNQAMVIHSASIVLFIRVVAQHGREMTRRNSRPLASIECARQSLRRSGWTNKPRMLHF
jgi:hypothetical protein